MRKLRSILRLLLAISILLGLIPAQAIALTCAKPVKADCHAQTQNCCGKKAACTCVKPTKPAPDLSATFSPSPQIQTFAILGETTPDFPVPNRIQPAQAPEPKANAPPGAPPFESASRAPPVNL